MQCECVRGFISVSVCVNVYANAGRCANSCVCGWECVCKWACVCKCVCVCVCECVCHFLQHLFYRAEWNLLLLKAAKMSCWKNVKYENSPSKHQQLQNGASLILWLWAPTLGHMQSLGSCINVKEPIFWRMEW